MRWLSTKSAGQNVLVCRVPVYLHPVIKHHNNNLTGAVYPALFSIILETSAERNLYAPQKWANKVHRMLYIFMCFPWNKVFVVFLGGRAGALSRARAAASAPLPPWGSPTPRRRRRLARCARPINTPYILADFRCSLPYQFDWANEPIKFGPFVPLLMGSRSVVDGRGRRGPVPPQERKY